MCEPDPRPVVRPAAGRRLARMLRGEHPDLLPEWLTAVTARGLRLPPQLLPTLLDRARRDRSADGHLTRLVAEAGGPRVRWLAGLNPDWEVVLAETLTGDEAWRLGSATQRRAYLTALHARDPAAARDLITGSWVAAGPEERVMFVNAMADGLSLADEPLLEAALDDRAVEVRSGAASVLHRLPGSALGQRMAERALRCVGMEYGPRGPRLVITPPTECDASMRRDGIVPGPEALLAQSAGRVRLLFEMVTRTPLRTWTDAFGLTAAQLVALQQVERVPVVFVGWARAAVAQCDPEWTAALIGHALTADWPQAHTETLRRLARQADPALGAPGTLPEPRRDALPVIGAVLSVLRFRYDMMKEVSDDGHVG
jgi:hypothetical protein